MKMEIKLSAEELEIVIGDYLRSRGMSVNAIAYQMKEVEVGVQWDPHKKLIFEGIKCDVELNELPKVNYNPTRQLMNDAGRSEQHYDR